MGGCQAIATAGEYRASGWSVLELHPGDVTPLTDDRFGLDVLVPDDEFEELQAVVATENFDRTAVYTAEDGGVRFYVTVVEATAVADLAVVIPAFPVLEELPALRIRADQEDEMYTHVRTLAADETITFRHDDPDLFC